MNEIYLDNSATTFLDPRVAEAMQAFQRSQPGNASSLHSAGLRAAVGVEKARNIIAGAVGASPDEVIFCSGGTEANNMALQGLATHLPAGAHFIVSAVEHSSVLDQVPLLKARGVRISIAPVTADGRIDLDQLAKLFTSETKLVSVMHVNNEIGTVQPIEEIAALCRERKALFHSDAVQSFCKIPIHLQNSGIDLITISAHKIHGPVGIGALVLRKGLDLSPLLRGGSHEKGIRPGTLNAAGAVGFGAAVELFSQEETARITRLRDSLLDAIQARFPQAILNGSHRYRAPHNLHLTFPGKQAIDLATELNRKGVCVSTGSACRAGSRKPSHVLVAISSGETPRDGLRISLSRFTTQEEIHQFVKILGEVL